VLCPFVIEPDAHRSRGDLRLGAEDAAAGMAAAKAAQPAGGVALLPWT